MGDKPKVLVVASFHDAGERLPEVLESILAQEGVELALRASDDCSKDGTWERLQACKDAHDGVSVTRNGHALGEAASFAKLLSSIDAGAYDYVAFAGQGDVWRPGKLAAAVSRISSSAPEPELYYGGVNLVGPDGQSKGNRYAACGKLAAKPLSVLLVENWADLSTMVINRMLLRFLQQHRNTDYGRSFATWVHAVCVCLDGRCASDFGECHVDRPAEGEGPEHGLYDAGGSALPAGEAAKKARTKMARRLVEGYESLMEEDLHEIVCAVMYRETSFACRVELASCERIAMPSSARSATLRSRLLANRL